MAFNTRKSFEEEFEEKMGIKPEDLKAKLANFDTVIGTVNGIKEKIDTQGTGIDEVKGIVTELKSAFSSVGNGGNGNNGNTGGNGNSNSGKSPIEWGEDAEGAFNQRITPLVTLSLDTRSSISKRNVMDEVNAQNHDWHLFSDEINAVADKEAPQARSSEIFWRNVYHMVKGKHLEEIIRDNNQKSGKFYVESGSSSSVRITGNEENKDVLSSEEMSVATKLGIDQKDYLEQKKKMTFWRN